MVRDGYYCAAFLLAAALLIGWLAGAPWAVPCLLLAAFFLWFFRDPEREVPDIPGAIVSPADGKVTDISTVVVNDSSWTRISIFLSVFDVHVNRSPVAGTIRDVRYQRGKFLNAMSDLCADQNEQNIVTVEGEHHTVVFKQIAGLLARRIVFTKKVGDVVRRGERVGLIKFGSRTDVLFASGSRLAVSPGDKVKGGSSILAYLQPKEESLATVGAHSREGER
ncbi:MAG TPA: phosphatidylserine decarboxylase [Terriglobales bacterium]|nr:phosphatidylserine decarboxylase [Terriglobales bacterium]